MKKLIASVLCLTIAMSLAACSKKAPEATSSGINGTTVQTTATAPSAEPSATETTVYNPASEFVKERTERFFFKGEVDEDGEKEDDEEIVLHIPELLIKSSYADSINKEINASVERYKKMTKGEYCDDQFCADAYIAYLTKEGILSLVFIAYEETDLDSYKVYNIDVKTGEKIENARIAEIAGVKDIRKAAMDALQNWYNKMEIVKVKDYKVVLEAGQKADEETKGVENSFSEKYLNDKMKIGLTNEGKIFFISEVCTMAGADTYEWAYDANGANLDDETNPYWVGWDDPDDAGPDDEEEDDDEEEADDDDT